MDLFSGSFGCFKRVGKDGKADVEDDSKTSEKIKIWVLRCSRTGHVHYLEAYNDFVDVLLGFLMLRTGALIRLNREVSPALKQAKTSGGVYGVYDSFTRLDDSMVLVDKEILLDPFERLKVSEELQALDSGDFECCNADCFKYLSGSRQICRSCTIATHFSCISCGGYFRENAHTSLCYTPWRPWRNHMTAAPILTRYTVIQSRPPTDDKPKKEGYVRKNFPFIVTNELIITPMSTSTLSEVLRSCGAGSCEDLECNELSIGTREVLVMLGAALTSPTPLTDIFGKMCNARTRVSCSGSGASFSQFPPCQKISKFCDQDGSSKRRPKSIPCCKSNRNQKMSKFQDHDDSSIRRPMSTTSTLPPCEKTSRFHDRDDSSVRRETSILKNAMMNQKHSPDQSSSQSPLRQQVQEQRAVYTPTECISSQSSLRRESVQKQMPRKISFQQQSSEAPEPQSNCFGFMCPSPRPSPPQSPRAIASESSFIELANFGKTPYQHLRRKANCTPCSTPESQSMEQMASPIIRPEMSTETVVQQAPLTGRPSSICPIDDCARVSSQSPPLRPNSMSIINPLFQQSSPSDNMSSSKSCQPPTSPPLRAPSIIENELLPCIARPSQNVVNNIRHGPRIVHRSLSPVLRQPGVTKIRPAVSFRKNSGGTGLASMRSIAGAFERGSEQSCSTSEVGSDFSDRSEYSDDHI